MASSAKPRLLLIGIDGADYRITELLMDRGQLPNLQALAARGAWGALRSTVPPVTPPAWTTLMTGKNPGKHGVFDFLPMDGSDPDIPVAARRRAVTMWRALSQRGYQVGTFNVPCTYPPEPLSGFQVPGFGAPRLGSAHVHPPRAFDVLQEAAEGYDPFPSASENLEQDARARQDRVDLVLAGTDGLLRAFPCDVFMVNFQVVDWMQHRALCAEMAPGDVGSLRIDGEVAGTYRLVDDRVGALLSEWASPDTHIMVVSDHGGTVADRLVNMEKLLVDAGLLTYALKGSASSSSLDAKRARAKSAVRVWGAIKRRSPAAARRLAPLARRLRGQVSAYEAEMEIDWSRTQAVPWGFYGQVRFNLQGRDPEGIVLPSAAPALTEKIRGLVMSLTDPDSGKLIYQEVRSSSDVYRGAFASEGPDLISLIADDRYMTVCNRMFSWLKMPLIDLQEKVAVVLDTPTGFHSSVGIMFMAGPSVQHVERLPESNLADIAPTALHLLGEEVPRDMDGQPVLAALDSAALAERPVRKCAPWPVDDAVSELATYTQEERAQVREYLASLGYL